MLCTQAGCRAQLRAQKGASAAAAGGFRSVERLAIGCILMLMFAEAQKAGSAYLICWHQLFEKQ
jgi:hypothetical protein